MSAPVKLPVKQYNNAGRALPKAPEDKPSQKRESLGQLLPLHSPSDLPRLPLNQQKFPDNVEPEVPVSPKSQTPSPKNPNRPVPKASPTPRAKAQRGLTTPGQRPEFSTAYSLNPKPLGQPGDIVNFGPKLENLATELEDQFAEVFDSEIKTQEPPPQNKNESNSPKKKPKKSSKLAVSLDNLGMDARMIPVQNQSGISSPKSRPIRPSRLQRADYGRRLTTIHRARQDNVLPPNTVVPTDPSDAGSGSEN